MNRDIHNLNKRFGPTAVCDAVNLHIASAELVALLRPSGSGKTSLLRSIAGLELPDSGQVCFEGADAMEAKHANVRIRGVGFVFQHHALFNHLSVFENVAFGLRVRPRATRPSDADIQRRVKELLQRVQLDGLAARLPHQLSGGQRQRVAVARGLAVEPKVLLPDEPFGALDTQVRKELRRWLRRLHDEMRLSTVLVTHDQDEALEVADRVVLMHKGRIEQQGTPDALLDAPATDLVRQFMADARPRRAVAAEAVAGKKANRRCQGFARLQPGPPPPASAALQNR